MRHAGRKQSGTKSLYNLKITNIITVHGILAEVSGNNLNMQACALPERRVVVPFLME